MLPGRRTYSDEDVQSVLSDALEIYSSLKLPAALPDACKQTLLASCVSMVGQRTDDTLIAGLATEAFKNRGGK